MVLFTNVFIYQPALVNFHCNIHACFLSAMLGRHRACSTAQPEITANCPWKRSLTGISKELLPAWMQTERNEDDKMTQRKRGKLCVCLGVRPTDCVCCLQGCVWLYLSLFSSSPNSDFDLLFKWVVWSSRPCISLTAETPCLRWIHVSFPAFTVALLTETLNYWLLN